MVNRYGMWMDTNTVIPTGERTCTVLFDYFLDVEKTGLQGPELDKLITESLVSSDEV